MPRLNFAAVRSSRIPTVLGLKASDTTALRDYVNEAQQRLLDAAGNGVGWQQRYAFCVNQACITMPRQVLAIDAMSVCQCFTTVRNGWYEFLEQGPGIQTADCGYLQCIDRGGGHVAFDDIEGLDKRIKVYADRSESATARILLQGWDTNGNQIYSLDGTTVVEGEYVSISTTPQFTVNKFAALTGVQKPATNGIVRLYEFNTVSGQATKALAFYEPSETLPNYRRYLLAGLNSLVDADNGEHKSVTAMVSLQHIPVVSDLDYLVVGNLAALKDACVSVKLKEEGKTAESQAMLAEAVRLINAEQLRFEGQGTAIVPRVIGGSLFGASGVDNLVGNNTGWY